MHQQRRIPSFTGVLATKLFKNWLFFNESRLKTVSDSHIVGIWQTIILQRLQAAAHPKVEADYPTKGNSPRYVSKFAPVSRCGKGQAQLLLACLSTQLSTGQPAGIEGNRFETGLNESQRSDRRSRRIATQACCSKKQGSGMLPVEKALLEPCCKSRHGP